MEKPNLEMELIDEINIPGVELYTEMESVDETEIKGEPMPKRLDNEYVEENEVVETTITNLRSGTIQKTTVNETTARIEEILIILEGT